jgi:hypothetical protein
MSRMTSLTNASVRAKRLGSVPLGQSPGLGSCVAIGTGPTLWRATLRIKLWPCIAGEGVLRRPRFGFPIATSGSANHLIAAGPLESPDDANGESDLQ